VRAHGLAGTLAAAFLAAHAGAQPAAQPVQVVPVKPDPNTSTALVGRITGIAVDPSAPNPDQTIRVKLDGFGNCKVWFGLELVEAATPSPYPPSSGWNPAGALYEMGRPPDAVMKLPGELPSLRLAAGKWKVAVSSHEGFNGNCKGSAERTFVVGESKTLKVGGAQGPPVGGVVPQTGNNTKTQGAQGPAGAAAGAGAQGNAAATSSLQGRITGLSIQPAAPKPDETIRVKVDGFGGSCKVWFGMVQLEGNPYPVPSGWNPAGVISDLTRPPDATVKLPGELSPLRLGAGKWKVGVDSHEGFNGNCKGNAELTFVVAAQAPLTVKSGPAPPAAGAANAVGGNASQGAGGATQSNTGGAGPASAAATLAQRITSVKIAPATPKPDEAIRILVDGVGTCKVWLFMTQIAGPKSPLPSGWNPMGLVGELTRPPDATLRLPGELAPVRLGAGTWKVRVDSHEGFKGGNCKGYPEVEFVVADRVLARPTR
jgi:hypothetical protein